MPRSLYRRQFLGQQTNRFRNVCGNLSRSSIQLSEITAIDRWARRGEAFVVELERSRLSAGNRADLARQIKWTAEEDGDGAGYDISSFSLDGHPQFIEVKTTNGSSRTPFFLTRNECRVAEQCPIEWRIYRVHLFASGPRIFTIAPPLEMNVKLSPETWLASFF